MIDVLIIATSPIMRAGLRALLADSACRVVGELAYLDQIELNTIPFDLLLIADDDFLPDLSELVTKQESLSLVLLSDDNTLLSYLRQLPLHGWALLPPDTTALELQAACQAATQGLVILSLPTANELISPRATTIMNTPIEPLTTRESQILSLLGEGLPNKLIARNLQISPHTVKFHVSSILTKLGAISRTDAVTKGARYGLIVL